MLLFVVCGCICLSFTHRELLHSSLQALRVEVGLFGRQLVLCCLKPPDEGTREAAELEQLLLAGLDGSKSVQNFKNRTIRREVTIGQMRSGNIDKDGRKGRM